MKRYLYLNVQCNLILKYYRYTATHWLSKSLQDIPRSAFEDAMNRGILLGNSDADCADFFGVCLSWPDSYRFPGIRDPSWRNSTDHLVVENRRKISEKTIAQFLKIADDLYDFENSRLNSME